MIAPSPIWGGSWEEEGVEHWDLKAQIKNGSAKNAVGLSISLQI